MHQHWFHYLRQGWNKGSFFIILGNKWKMFDFLINKKDLDRSILKNGKNQGKAKKCSHWALYPKEPSDNSNLSPEHSHGTTNN